MIVGEQTITYFNGTTTQVGLVARQACLVSRVTCHVSRVTHRNSLLTNDCGPGNSL